MAVKITVMGKYSQALAGSKRCPVKTIKAYLSHLNPEVDALFQRPKDASVRFSPEKDSIWFERMVLGHAGKYAEEHDSDSRDPAIFHEPLSQGHNSHRSFFSERGDTAN